MSKLIPLEFNNQRIMTTKVLAEQYDTEEKNIQMNFSNNFSRFKESKHYLKLEGQALKDFKNSLPDEIREDLKFSPALYLWTDRGAARHAKILDTDEAWEAYEELEENYFNPKENVQSLNTSELSPELQMFKQIFDCVAKQQLEQQALKGEVQAIKQANEETNSKLDGIKDIVSLSSTDWKKDTSSLISKMALKLGGFEHISDLRKESYNLLNQRTGVELETRLTNKRRRMAEEGVCKFKRDKLNYVDIIAEDKKELEVYLAIVKEMAIKYGV